MNYQAARTPKDPTTTLKFSRTPGCVNRKKPIYETKVYEALFKQAKKSLNSDSEGKFALTSKEILPLSGVLTGHANSCGWYIFDVPIATEGSTEEILGRYGEITLSDIKAQTETINAPNGRRVEEDEQLYTCLMK